MVKLVVHVELKPQCFGVAVRIRLVAQYGELSSGIGAATCLENKVPSNRLGVGSSILL